MRIDRARRFRRAVAAGGGAVLVEHAVVTPHWNLPDLRIAVLSDLHVCAPWTRLSDIDRAVTQANALAPDLIVLAGDFLASRRLPGRRADAVQIARALAPLRAPLGVIAVLGNHDWQDCALAQQSGLQRNSVREALAGSAIALLENSALRLDHGAGLWVAGLDSQRPGRRGGTALHDPDAAFAEVPEGATALLVAHEPDYFADGDPRAILQISGHTHGGQANLGGWRPLTPSAFGGRYAWGHIRDGDRHLVVSGGIGYSGVPLRLFQPPEITLVTLRCGG